MNDSLISAAVVITVIGSAIAFTRSRGHDKSQPKPACQPAVPLDAKDLRTRLHSLLEELRRNREHAAHQYQGGGLSKIKLATVAWDAVKYNLGELDKDLAASIRLAYMEVWRFNLIPGGEVKDPLPDGSPLEDFMRTLALRAKIGLVMAERDLSAHLGKELHDQGAF